MLDQDRIVTCPTGTGDDAAVEMRGVTKTFAQWQRSTGGRDLLRNLFHPAKKEVTALDEVSFRVARGEFTAYAGPNGAGKSTTMKLLSGMLLPNAGEISVLGMSPKSDRIPLMRRVGVMFGNRTELWWDHPVVQSFEWKRVVWEIPKERYRRILDTVVELLDIGDLLQTFARELSLGQRMRADLAMMLLHEPELILLDEPTIGLDVLAKRQMISILKHWNRERGTTILVTSHDMDDLEEMARRIVMIERGRIAFDGSFEALRDTVGQQCRVVLTVESELAPVLTSVDGADVTRVEDARVEDRKAGVHALSDIGVHRYEYVFDKEKIPISELLAQFGRIPGIRDVEIKKASIEEIIAEMYGRWKV